MAKRIIVLVVGIALLVVLGALSGLARHTPVGEKTTVVVSNDSGEVPTDWKYYQSKNLGVSLRYPTTYKITEAEGAIVIQHAPDLVSNITISREKGLMSQIWGLQATETHRESRKDLTASPFIVTSFSTGDPSIARQYILFPKDFPRDRADTEEDVEGLMIQLLGGDSLDKNDVLTPILEKIVFSIVDTR
ncbi:MAG: hypothetical protein EXS51_00755 [Candidatus Taylorbacteria bacterium]|nr:hypothetical protein [Candidatus Taylorbacteria bacterium]